MKKNKKDSEWAIKPLSEQSFKEIKNISNLAAWITIILSVIFAAGVIFLGLDTMANFDKYSKEDILNEEVPVLSYIKTINHYDSADAVEVLERMKDNKENATLDVVFEMVVPTILYLANLATITYCAVAVLKLFKASKTEGKFYTNENADQLLKIIEALSAVILYYILFFNIIVVLPLLLSDAILGLLSLSFKKAVKNQEEIKKLKQQLKEAK